LSNTTAQRRSAARGSARTASRARSRPAARSRRPSRTATRRRRFTAILAALFVGAVIAVVAMLPQVKEGIQELTLPLRHEDIIRQQAADKNLDPALLAAMIYQESKFRDRTSSAGAKGLMQILPTTAQFIAHKSGGTAFELRDLGTPQINISYGSWYLRYLIDRYEGNITLAIAAYNAGEHNVDIWIKRAGGEENFDPGSDIPFPETRHYVHSVMEHRVLYREKYAAELGIE
jgi:soluble lytic murein transglycosylase